jgi:FkbM family methyltransferase
LTDNGVSAQVVEAAVGPEDGTARFKEPRESNQGRVADSGDSDEGYEVRMASVASLLGILAHNGCAASIDLVKMDIEGSEEQVFSGDLNWLQHVRSLIVEFHPWLVDPGSLRAAVENKGFRRIPADAAYGGSPEAFVRRDDGSRGLPGTEAPSPGA